MMSVEEALKEYEGKRVMRAASIHGFARSAALMTTTWRPYLGTDPYDFYKYIPGAMAFWGAVEKLRIPHPGKVMGQIAMMSSIDLILEYIACGVSAGMRDRKGHQCCRRRVGEISPRQGNPKQRA